MNPAQRQSKNPGTDSTTHTEEGEMMRRWISALTALPIALACGGDGGMVTSPAEDVADLQQLQVSANELASSEFLDDLSDDDRTAVRAALQRARDEIRAILDQARSGALTRDAARDRIETVHDGLIDALSEILTDEQIESLLQRRDRPGNRPDLDLTEAQVEQIRSLLEAFHQFVREVRALVEAGDLTPRQGRREVRAKAHKTSAAVCSVLEPDQQAKVGFCRGPIGGPGNGPPGGSPPGRG